MLQGALCLYAEVEVHSYVEFHLREMFCRMVTTDWTMNLLRPLGTITVK